MKDINTMSEKERKARARAFEWIDDHMWLTNEALKLTLLEDLEIPEIIELIEDNVAGNTRYPADLIGELRRVA